MRVTIKDVAKAAYVSVATASMAINGKKGISDATRERVLEAAKQLNYVPDYSARALVKRESNTIGLIIPEIQNPFYCAIVDLITRIAEDKGYTLLLGITNNSTAQEQEYVKVFLSRRVLGVIVVPVLKDAPDARHLNMLRQADVPMVFCTDRYDGTDEPAVMCDFELGQYEMTKYLLSKGLRDLCFVSTSMRAQFSILRRKGFERALNEHGITLPERKFFLLEHTSFWDAYAATDAVIAEKPDAIVCINDIMTIGIVKRLMELDIDVPGSVSVAGFDDTMFSELVSKPLSTVRQPLPAICGQVMDILEEKMALKTGQRAVRRGETYFLKPELVIRATTI